MVVIHIWQDSECSEFRLRELPRNHSVTTHIRSKPLNKPYLTHMVQTVTTSKGPSVHILLINNRDVKENSPDWLIWAIDFLGQITHLRLSAIFACVDLTIGRTLAIRKFKRSARKILLRNPNLVLKDLGCKIHTDDLRHGFHLSRSASMWVEQKLVQLICISIVSLSRV
jgi:hypothetical protein